MRYTTTALSIALILTSLPLVAGKAAAGEGKCSAEASVCLNEFAKRLQTKGWVGIEMDDYETGNPTITKVIADSPAEAAGFAVGDRIVAFNGEAYGKENETALKKAYKQMIPGNTVTFTVERAGSRVDLPVKLGRIPEQLMAQWIGQHMLEAHVSEDVPDNQEKIAEHDGDSD